MTFKVIFLLCLLGWASQTIEAQDSEITKFMKHLEVIPDVIDDGPKYFLEVKQNFHFEKFAEAVTN